MRNFFLTIIAFYSFSFVFSQETKGANFQAMSFAFDTVIVEDNYEEVTHHHKGDSIPIYIKISLPYSLCTLVNADTKTAYERSDVIIYDYTLIKYWLHPGKYQNMFFKA